jgi:antitoxin Phd
MTKLRLVRLDIGFMKKKKTLRRSRYKSWQLQEAKAKFSQMINDVQKDGCYTITKNGEPVAILMSKQEFETLSKPEKTLLEFFEQAPLSDTDLDLDRSPDLGRDLEL